MASGYFVDWEGTDWQAWNIQNTNLRYVNDDSVFYEGGTSGHAYSGGSRVQGPYAELDLTQTLEGSFNGIEFYFREPSSNSFGFHLTAVGDSRRTLFGVGSDNPQWDVEDNNGVTELYGGDGYLRWVRVQVIMDIYDGTFDVTFEDTESGTTRSTTGTLGGSGEIEYIYLTMQPKFSDQQIDVWLDSMRLFKKLSVKDPSVSWEHPETVYVNNGGTWEQVQRAFVNKGGNWEQVWRDPSA